MKVIASNIHEPMCGKTLSIPCTHQTSNNMWKIFSCVEFLNHLGSTKSSLMP
jgi:hypothetical protein